MKLKANFYYLSKSLVVKRIGSLCHKIQNLLRSETLMCNISDTVNI
jgi:hypothetical protein